MLNWMVVAFVTFVVGIGIGAGITDALYSWKPRSKEKQNDSESN